MTADELARAGRRLYGHGWHGRLAEALGVNLRTLQRWASGRNEVPGSVAEDVVTLLRVREKGSERREGSPLGKRREESER